MKRRMELGAFAGLLCLTVSALTASAAEPWGWAVTGERETALTNRSTTGAACLVDGDLESGVEAIRFAAGEIALDRISVRDRNIAFIGASDGTTKLTAHPSAVYEYGGAIDVVGCSVTVSNLAFAGFCANSAGGALSFARLTGDSTIVGCLFTNCRANDVYGNGGGAVYATSERGVSVRLTLSDSTFENCKAILGGAFYGERIYPYYEDKVTLAVERCTFCGNRAESAGGALMLEGDATLADTTFVGNSTAAYGGAIYVGSVFDQDDVGATVRLQPGVVFDRNVAADGEGVTACGGAVALMNDGIAFSAEKTAFLGNEATILGGAVCSFGVNRVSLSTSIFSNNLVSASGFGGAVSVQDSTCSFTNLTVRGSNRGALDLYRSTVEVVNSVAVDNDDADLNVEGENATLRAFRTAFGVLSSYVETDGVEMTECLAGRTAADFDGVSLRLKGKPDYNPIAAEGLAQTVTDFDGVAYGSRPYGYSMGAYECETVSCVSGTPTVCVYDGEGHTNVYTSGTAVLKAAWTYSLTETGPYVGSLACTNVGVYTIWARADFGGYAETACETLTITQRVASVTAKSASKTYDGQPLTEDGWTQDGFVGSEGVETAVTSGSITDVGSVSNCFASIVYKANTLISNYVVTTNLGELTVNPYDDVVTVKIQGHTNTVTWTGREQSTNGWTFVSASTDIFPSSAVALKEGHSARAVGTNVCETAYMMGLDPAGGDFACTNKNFTNVEFEVGDGWLKIDRIDLSAGDVEAWGPADVVYTGDAHKPADIVLSNKVLSAILELGQDYEIREYLGNVDVTNAAVVVFRGLGNYTNEFGATFAITQKVLTVTADDKAIVFGEDKPAFTYAIGGFVKDEKSRESQIVHGTPTLACDTYSVGKPVGDYDITVDVAGLLARNYSFRPENGTLTVGNAELRYTATPVNTPYDGLPHMIGLDVTAPASGVTTNFATRAEDLWQGVTQMPTYVSVTNTTLWYVLSAPNYGAVTGSVSVVITPRPVTITSPTWTNEYTGAEMSFTADDLDIGGSLMAGDESFVFGNFAKITDVGSVKATFDIFNGTANTNNYAITNFYGRLTVVSTNRLLVVAQDGEWTYDATEHVTNDCTVVNPDVLRNGDRFVALGYSGAITEPGRATNEITEWDIVNTSGVSVRKNYLTPKFESGELVVRKATFSPTALPYAGAYDGKPHGISVDAGNPVGDVRASVGYSRTKDGPFDETDPEKIGYAGVTNGLVWFRITAEPAYYEPYVGCASVDISKLGVEFWSTNATARGTSVSTDLDYVRASMKVSNAENALPEGEVLRVTSPATASAVGTVSASYEIVAGTSGTDLGNYAIKRHFGELTVLSPDGLTVKAKSAVLAFNGTTQTLHEVEFDRADLIDPTDIVQTEFAEGSRVFLPREGIVSNVIDSVKVLRGGENVTGEYRLTLLPGFLSVTNLQMTGVTAVSTNVVYDGGDYSIGVKVPPGLLSTPKVTYSRNGAPGSYGANPTFRHYAQDPNTVFFRIEADGYDTFEGRATVQIRQRPATFVSDGATHVFDGGAFSHEVAYVSAETPLAAGDGLVASSFTVVTNVTKEGGVENRFGLVIVNPAEPDADLVKDYDVSYDYGRLVVSPRLVAVGFTVVSPRAYDGTTNAILLATNVIGAVAGDTLSFDPTGMAFYFRDPSAGVWTVDAVGYDDSRILYSGTNPVGKGNYCFAFDPETTAEIILAGPPSLDEPNDDPKGPGPYFGPGNPPTRNPPVPERNPDGSWTKLSNYDVVTVYDGKGHTLDSAALAKAIETNKWISAGYGISYSADGHEWTRDLAAFSFTNVVATSFWYNVEAPFGQANYSNYIHAVGVTITQRVASVTAKSASKTFDGTPLTEEGWTQDGFVASEGVETAVTSGSITDVGSVSNRFASIAYKGNTLISNYVVATNQGELTVTPYGGATVTIRGNTGTVTYAGREQSVSGWAFVSSSTDLIDSSMIALKSGKVARAAGTDASATAYPMGLDAAGADFTCTSKNFSNVTFEVTDGWLKIDPVGLADGDVVVTGPADCVYSGVAQRPTDVTVSNKVLKTVLTQNVDYVIESYSNNTNATGAAVVWIHGTGNYADGTSTTFRIMRRAASVTAKSATKTYDGLPLTEKGWTQAGFVSGEGVASAVTAGTITDVGSVSNRLVSIAYTARTLFANYVVVTNQGVLKVTPYSGAKVTIQGNTRTVTYTGREQSVTGWTFVSSSTSLLKSSMIALRPGKTARAAGTNVRTTAYAMGLNAAGADFECTSKNFSNVTFVVRDGWLKVNPFEITGTTAAITKTPSSCVYSGGALRPTDMAVSNKVLNVVLKYGVDFVADRYENNTNVTDAAVVWIRGIGNYANSLSMTFRITRRPITVRANAQKMVYSDILSLTPGFGSSAAWGDATSGQTDKGLAKGERIGLVKLCFKNSNWKTAYTPGTHAGAIVLTNWTGSVSAGDGRIVISNATSDVTSNYTLSFQAGNLTVANDVPKFTATLEWVQSGDNYLAHLMIANENRTDYFKLKDGSMRFLFPDRVGTGEYKGNIQLWHATEPKGPQSETETYDGQTYRVCRLETPAIAWKHGVVNWYGPSKTDTALVRLKAAAHTPVVHVEARQEPCAGNEAKFGLAPDAKGRSAFLAWLVWESEDGGVFAFPLLAGNNSPNTIQTVKSVSFQSAARVDEALLRAAAVKSAAYGVTCEANAEPVCDITEFVVGERTLSCRIVMRTASGSGTPTEMADIWFCGTDDLGLGFTPAVKAVRQEDGSFAADKPDGMRFFRVRVGVAE